jgi:trans-aconitate 2-methyltransferase
MIDKAVAHGGPAWLPGRRRARLAARPDVDVLVTNATLQWVPATATCCPLGRELPAGAWLAMQVPGNFDAPSHRLLRRSAARYGARRRAREAPVDDPAGYADLLTRPGRSVDAWETTYLHLLPAGSAEHPVLRWMEGTALRPVKAALDENAWQSFRAELTTELSAAYQVSNGYVAFPFRRIFVVAPNLRPEGTSCDRADLVHRRPAEGRAARAPRGLGVAAHRRRAGRPPRGRLAGAGRPGALGRLLRVPRLRHFIEVYLTVVDLIRDDEDVRMLTYEVARELARQQVRYAELTVTPVLQRQARHPGRGVLRRDRGRPPGRLGPSSASTCAGASTSRARRGWPRPRRPCGSRSRRGPTA